jgi:uncharacterized tellurite resistance protein B-like protein
MGIFEKVLQEHQPETLTLTPAEAFAALVLSTVRADGRISAEEASRVNQVLGATRLFHTTDTETLQPLLSQVMSLVQRHGPDAVMDLAARALPVPLRAPAFAVSVDLVLADGEAGPQERRFIDALQTRLAIADEEAAKIVDVMLVKNSV